MDRLRLGALWTFGFALMALGTLVIYAPAYAATAGALEPATGTWRVYRGSSFSAYVCSANSEIAALDCASKDADARKTTSRYQIRYPNRYVTVTYTLPATCTTPKPDSQTRSQACPTGIGTWTQTSSYREAPFPQCWIAEWPTSPPADACQTLSPVLFSDTFRNGAKAPATNGVGWLGRGTSIAIVPYASSPTGYAMRFRYAGASSGNDGWAEQRFTLPELTEVWLEVVLDIPANYVHRDDTSTDNNKLVRFWTGDLSDGRDGYGRYSIKGGFSTIPSSDGSDVIVEFGRRGDDVGRNSTGQAPFITAADKGKRLTLVIHAKTDTTGLVGTQNAAKGGNGALELWKNGRKVIGYTELQWRSIDGKLEFFTHGYLLGWANSGFTQTTDIHVLSVSASKTNVYGVH
jgi:hypothetical protein